MKDLTKGKPSVLILSFALPVFLANLLQLTYSIVDTRIVGTFLGENMLAAKKYVAVCLGLHRMGHDKVTSMKQSTDKRYINARTHPQQSVYLRETVNYQIWK